jgi:hypothetical protein
MFTIPQIEAHNTINQRDFKNQTTNINKQNCKSDAVKKREQASQWNNFSTQI